MILATVYQHDFLRQEQGGCSFSDDVLSVMYRQRSFFFFFSDRLNLNRKRLLSWRRARNFMTSSDGWG